MSNQQNNPELDEYMRRMRLENQGGFRPGAPTFSPGAPSFQPGAPSFSPGAPSFTPGAPSFTPGQGQYYNQYQPQYQQPQYHQQYQQYQQYAPQQHSQGYQADTNWRSRSQQPVQNDPIPTSWDAPTAAESKDTPPQDAAAEAPKPKAKVLSIGPAKPKAEPKAEAKSEAKAPAAPKAEPKAASAPKAVVVPKGEAKTASTPTSGRDSPSRASDKKPAARAADAVEQDQAADVDEETLKEIYGKEHVNIIFIGHVDAGKSTLGGSILYATGMVDERTMEKNKREAKELGRETWYLSWALDLTKEERSKGKTVEVGRGFFETEKRRYSILDAPGHKTYVPSMIGGASQADVGILVISARKGEYETGFEKGGQTREHAMLAKTQGVNKLVVVINKMDDPTVDWSEERYKECTTKLAQFLKATGYNLKTDVFFMPIAAQQTINIKDRIPKGVCSFYDGPSLLEYLDDMKALERKVNAPFMMPINGKYREMGTIVEGKIEAGVVKKGMSLIMMPNREKVEVAAAYGETEDEVPVSQSGDQCRLRLKGIEEEDVLPGFVLCSPKRLVHCVSAFEAQIRVLELKSILSAGFNCVLHVHSAIEEVTFSALLHKLQKGTNRKSKLPPSHAKKGDSIIARLEVIGGAGSVCVEKFEDYAQLGRFTLRDQGQTIAIGKITKLITDEAPVAAA